MDSKTKDMLTKHKMIAKDLGISGDRLANINQKMQSVLELALSDSSASSKKTPSIEGKFEYFLQDDNRVEVLSENDEALGDSLVKYILRDTLNQAGGQLSAEIQTAVVFDSVDHFEQTLDQVINSKKSDNNLPDGFLLSEIKKNS